MNFIAVHQTNINTNTLLTVRFRLRSNLRSALGVDWGRLILRLPTADPFYEQAQFPDGFGRFTKNGREIDCNCNECPTYATPIVDGK